MRFQFMVGLAFLICLSVASAQIQTFDASVVPVKDRIAFNDTAEFDIVITNSYSQEREFKIHKGGYPFWDTFVKPLTNPITVTIRPDRQETVRLFVKPLHVNQIDTYTVDSQVEDLQTGRKQRIPLTISILSNEGLVDGYVPTVLASVKMPDRVDPRQGASLALTLDNQNPLDFPDVTVVVSSNNVKGEYHYPLGPRESKTVNIPLQFSELAQPQQDTITVSLFRDGKSLVKPLEASYRISSYSTQEETQPQGRMLKEQYTITVFSNDPNYQGTVEKPVGFFEKLFITSSPDPTDSVKRDGVRYLIWTVDNIQDNKAEIVVTKNYRPLVIIILLILILIGLYYVFRSPLVITKEVAAVSGREGGVTSVKIVLKLRNRGKEALHQIEVGDVIPQIAGLKKELSIGTLQPEKITRSHSKGTIVKWVVESLEPDEGVVLSYRMHSKLSILGEFNLPTATARFKHRNSYVITNSNRTIVTE